MDLPPVPDRVAALVASGVLPPEFGDAAEERLAAVDADEGETGALALAAAYGRLELLADDVVDPDVMDENNDRAVELLRVAEANGVDEDESLAFWWYSDRMRNLGAEIRDEMAAMEEYVAEHGTTPRGRLDAKLEQAHALYEAGDRAAAIALFREVAEISPWDSEFSGCSDRVDVGWCRLLHDAAHVDGPEAARRVWREARTHYLASTFPHTDHACRLIEMLLGTGVPDIVAVVAAQRREAAEPERPPGLLTWPLSEDEQRVLGLADAEVERLGGARQA
ncbi:hypothetical protein AB0K14_13375 [Actinosynnema sp. NPDC050801]|uniref:hypothetical protein n=1 Tax=unclassified Actinosynnema TaxID=2637065 RepID=UPI0033DDF50B